MRFFLSSCIDQQRLALFAGFSSLPTSTTLVRLKSFDYGVFQFYVGRSWTEAEKRKTASSLSANSGDVLACFFALKRHFLVKLSAE